MPSTRTPAPIGGRFGPRRTTSSLLYSTRTGPPVAIGQTPGDVGDLARHLAPEGTAVGQRRHRITARLAPRCVGLEVAGFDPRRLQRPVPVTRWRVDRPRQRRCRAPSLHLGGHPPRLGQRLADVPLPVGAAQQRPAHPRAPCRRRTRPCRVPRGRRPTGRSRPPTAPARSTCPVGCRGIGRDPKDSTVSTMVRHPVHRHRWAARARCTASTDVRSSIAATRTMIPGVQNPHCDAPLAVNASAHATASGSPSTVVTSRPATRPTGVTHETRGLPSTSTVQHPHCPCGLHPSLAERAPRRSRRTSRRETSVSAISTGRPSRRKEIRRSSDHSRRCGWRWGW